MLYINKWATCLTISVVNKDDIIIVQQRVWWGVGVCLHPIRVTAAVVTDVDHPTTVHIVLGYLRLATSRLPCWGIITSIQRRWEFFIPKAMTQNADKHWLVFDCYWKLWNYSTLTATVSAHLRFLLFPGAFSLLCFSDGKCFVTRDWNTPLKTAAYTMHLWINERNIIITQVYSRSGLNKQSKSLPVVGRRMNT